MKDYNIKLNEEELQTLIKACYNSCMVLDDQGGGFSKRYDMTFELRRKLLNILEEEHKCQNQ